MALGVRRFRVRAGLAAPIAVFPTSGQAHRGKDQAGHGIGLWEIAPQFPALRVDIFGQQTVTITVIERIKEEVARLLAPTQQPERVHEPEPANQERSDRQTEIVSAGITHDVFLAHELTLHRRNRADEPRVGRFHEPQVRQ